MDQFINPIDIELAEQAKTSESESHESNSRVLVHKGPSICPKCGKSMGFARLASDEQVFYCTGCRVSSPLPLTK
jgi:predicted  nucleic acid-binding Zn ribbon protein